jgi:hypothetical protein
VLVPYPTFRLGEGQTEPGILALGRGGWPDSGGAAQDGRALLRRQVITGFQQAGQQLCVGGEGTK